jgi:hypothetical protein
MQELRVFDSDNWDLTMEKQNLFHLSQNWAVGLPLASVFYLYVIKAIKKLIICFSGLCISIQMVPHG